MMNRMGKISAVLVLVLLALSTGAMAAGPISHIAQGNTVFLGEEGLDITNAMGGDTEIGWWASAAAIGTTSPSYTIQVSNPASFFISPSEFSGRLGPWYRIPPSGVMCPSSGCTSTAIVAFTVADPNLDIRLEDASLGVDATSNGWITTGDEVAFRITTNLDQMTQRGVAGAPITIKFQTPDGAVLSALINKAGYTTSLVEIPVSTSPYSTGPIWDTGRHDAYPYGTYTIWAECNANSMKDNYAESGKTYTSGAGILDQEMNPLIGFNTLTPVPTTAVTSAPTTVMTTVATTIPPTVTTAATVITTSSTIPPTVPATAAPTKSPGFEFVLAGSALLLALAWTVRKE
jgi:hypothetical protein